MQDTYWEGKAPPSTVRAWGVVKGLERQEGNVDVFCQLVPALLEGLMDSRHGQDGDQNAWHGRRCCFP